MNRRAEILHFFERYYELLDQDSHTYDLMLAYVDAWTDATESRAVADVMRRLDATIRLFQGEMDEHAIPAPDTLESDELEDAGIIPSELRLFLQERDQLLTTYIQEMTGLELYLEHYQTDRGWLEPLKEKCGRGIAIHRWERAYYFATVNYWFSGWEEEYVHYIKKHFWGHFQSFYADMVWQETRDEAERAMNGFLDHMQREAGTLAVQLGKDREELYLLQQELEEMRENHHEH